MVRPLTCRGGTEVAVGEGGFPSRQACRVGDRRGTGLQLRPRGWQVGVMFVGGRDASLDLRRFQHVVWRGRDDGGWAQWVVAGRHRVSGGLLCQRESTGGDGAKQRDRNDSMALIHPLAPCAVDGVRGIDRVSRLALSSQSSQIAVGLPSGEAIDVALGIVGKDDVILLGFEAKPLFG